MNTKLKFASNAKEQDAFFNSQDEESRYEKEQMHY